MRKVNIIGVPLDLGQQRRGVDMGPSALRFAGLNARIAELGWAVTDAGNLPVPLREMHSPRGQRAKYLKEIAATCRELAGVVGRVLRGGSLPLVLGGDHSIAVGTVAGVAEFYRKKGKKIGLIWVDAHTDMNTPETSPSGNVHGMPFAAILGYGPRPLSRLLGYSPLLSPANAVLVGARDVDLAERPVVRESGLKVFTMRAIDERGLRTVMQEAIAIAGHGTAGFCVSFDMDFVDPTEAPGVGTPVKGGATYREAHLVMELLADSGRILSMDMVEINPIIDVANKTGNLGVELILSALGKKIL